MYPPRVGKKARLTVEQDRLIFDAIPERFHNIKVFASARIPIAMIDISIKPEVHRFFRHRRRDDIPASPAFADMVKRGKHPGNIVSLGVGR